MNMTLLSLMLACSGTDDIAPNTTTTETVNTTTTTSSASPLLSSVFVIETSAEEAVWQDLAILAAIPTSAHITQGYPAVLTVDPASGMTNATQDLLARLKPEFAVTLNPNLNVPYVEEIRVLNVENASDWSLKLIEEMWNSAEHLVLASSEDYAGAILASSLAANLDAPLLFSDDLTDDEVAQTATDLAVGTVLSVTLNDSVFSAAVSVEMTDVDGVLEWFDSTQRNLSYLALTNPEDRLRGRAQKSSLFAPLYAAHHGGLSLPVSLVMPANVVLTGEAHPAVSYLEERYEALGYHPEYLAIVGAHDALPQSRKPSIFDTPESDYPVSDLPYGETDDDPFLDIAIGRIVGDTVAELSNLATRSANYDLLTDGNWENHFLESGLWGFDELRDSMLNVGYADPEHLSQSEIASRDFLEVGAILHKDHSNCFVLGNAFELDNPTLFSPSVVLSRGCQVGGMDLVATDDRSIVDHMLGSGAVAFVGGTRNSIAQNTLIEVSMWNAMLDGQSLGRAFQTGINDMTVHWLDEGESSAYRYSLDIEILYGDPGLTMSVPVAPANEPASQLFDGQTLTVYPPEAWSLVQYHPDMLSEWNYTGDLFMYTGPGASPKTYWSGSHDSEDMYFGVQLSLDSVPIGVQEQGSHVSPLGWGGGYYLDFHQDGSVTALWRLQLLDFDPYTGDVLAESAAFQYEIE